MTFVSERFRLTEAVVMVDVLSANVVCEEVLCEKGTLRKVVEVVHEKRKSMKDVMLFLPKSSSSYFIVLFWKTYPIVMKVSSSCIKYECDKIVADSRNFATLKCLYDLNNGAGMRISHQFKATLKVYRPGRKLQKRLCLDNFNDS